MPLRGTVFYDPSANGLVQVESQPLILSHVCSRWQALARCMPELWASLAIMRPDNEIFEYHAFKTLLRDLSFDIPLPIKLRPQIEFSLDTSTRPGSSLKTVSHRITTFHIPSLQVAGWESVAFGIYRAGQGNHQRYSLPMLETLAFRTLDANTFNYRGLKLLLENTHTPKLKELQVYQHDFRSPTTFTREFTTIPYTQLCSLTLEAYGHIDLHHILSSCPALASLTIALAETGTRSDHPISTTPLSEWHTLPTARSPIFLPKLRILSITFSPNHGGYVTVLPLFTIVTYPSLESLTLACSTKHIHNTPPHSEFWDTILASFIYGTNKKPVCLELEQVHITDSSLRKLLTLCAPTLEGLSLRNSGIFDGMSTKSLGSEVWTCLQDLGHPEVDFLPLLRTLRVSVTVGTCWREILPVIGEAVISRRASLESVVLEMPDAVLKQTSRDLSKLRTAQKKGKVAIKVLGYPSGKVYVGYEVEQSPSPPVETKPGRQTKIQTNTVSFKLAQKIRNR
ncbi:hypothetical protein AAF712_014075 [Marasmius tenuissimus]|uniref:F-box domain-containing protein n=1 Tax=Marasmius tenuissimus TaxID=585030 RepID=A0ABR2ZFI2_9AGAR|nr:hypothetical protein PM082_011397 [Marasmius tenuissimus]